MLIALDLDGTLLRDDKTVSDRCRRAIADATAVGHTVVLVTARHWLGGRVIATAAGVGGLLVCSNGAIVYDLAAQSVREQVNLDTEIARAFVKQVRADIPGVGVAWETAEGGYRDAIFHSLSDPTPTPYGKVVQLREDIEDDHPITKLLVGHATLQCHELIERLPVDRHEVHVWNSGGWFAEITSTQVSKANALATLAGELGLTADDVIAIGDQPVDIPMLQWAGRGIAMANAHPDVLAAVHEPTASNEEDGVAIVLEALTG